jgi:hypothetical protein
MAGKKAGYSGAVYSQYEAGFTSAQGYTGVVRGTIPSGYTGAAPVPSAPVSAKGSPGVAPVMVTASPYDGALANPGTAPGAAIPLDYRPPAPPIDVDAVRELEEVEDEEATESLSPAPDEDIDVPISAEAAEDADDYRSAEIINSIVTNVVGLMPELDRPEPEPNNALAAAERMLLGGGPHRPSRPSEIVRPLTDALNEQVARAIAASKPNNLGVAYVQGILQGLAGTLIGLGPGFLDTLADPEGAREDTMRAIREEMAKGASFWEAANTVLNPMTRALILGWEANNLAGEALAAAQRGEWDLAVRLARQSGNRAAGGGTAVVETVGVAEGLGGVGRQGMRAVKRLKRVRPAGRPSAAPPSPAPPPPPPPTQQAGPGVPTYVQQPVVSTPKSTPPPSPLTGAIGPRLPARPALPPAPVALTRPNPGKPDLRIFPRAYVETARPLLEQDLKGKQAEYAQRMRAEPPEIRMDDEVRARRGKRVYNALERVTAADLQLAHPERSFPTDATWVSLRYADGTEAPIRKIPELVDDLFEADLRPYGTTSDALEVAPDGTWWDLEMKRENAIKEAYDEGPGVEAAFQKSTKLSMQIRKRKMIVDYAIKNNASVKIRLHELDGSQKVVLFDPNKFKGSRVLAYRQASN